jgi:ppGpp synthetase/RelA/SpoT-type nucleotidyltranferase
VDAKKEAQTKLLQEHVKQYVKLFSNYKLFADILVQIFEKASIKYAPLAIVQARPKSIAGFAEKILRKNKYTDPVNQITDLCGARVITHLPEEVEEIGEFIKNNFKVDYNNSVDVNQRLKPTEFGYRSVHYIVQFKEGVFPNKDVSVTIPKELSGLKAEIQVRTILEHSWADYNHDLSYKGAFKIPQKWERELAGLAASLESADKTYSRVHSGLQVYATNFGAYMSVEQMQNELGLLELVLESDPQNFEVAHRIGKIAIVMGDWQKAISVLSSFVKSDYQPIIRDLGVALCTHYKDSKDSEEFSQGRKYLEIACAPQYKDFDALSSLAGTYRGIDQEKAHELYKQAFAFDSTNPYVLGNYLESELICRLDTSALCLVTPLIELAIKRSQSQAEVGVNLQWVYYDIGRFYLFLGKPYESLSAYAKALQVSVNDWVIEAALRSIDRLAVVKTQLPGYDWVQRLLLIGLASKFPESDAGRNALNRVKKLASTAHQPLKGPIVIVAGGNSSEVETQMRTYQGFMLEAFRDFKGTIISGGTISGVSGLVGQVQEKYLSTIKTVGYLPKVTKTTLIDKHYCQILFTEGEDFSPAEPIQYWIDLIDSGINSYDVKLLGINGGKISSIEYKIALALGASTAIIEGNKTEKEKLFSDKDWNTLKNLVPMLNDSLTAWAFVQSGAKKLDPARREELGQIIHENYLNASLQKKSPEPSLQDWANLNDSLKESNCQQADHIIEKLNRINCTTHLVTDREIALMKFSESEIETMAQMEHARGNVERFLDGWRKGPKDVNKKISPYLVPWSDLPEEIKALDRDAVNKIPEVLAKMKLEVRRAK